MELNENIINDEVDDVFNEAEPVHSSQVLLPKAINWKKAAYQWICGGEGLDKPLKYLTEAERLLFCEENA